MRQIKAKPFLSSLLVFLLLILLNLTARNSLIFLVVLICTILRMLMHSFLMIFFPFRLIAPNMTSTKKRNPSDMEMLIKKCEWFSWAKLAIRAWASTSTSTSTYTSRHVLVLVLVLEILYLQLYFHPVLVLVLEKSTCT